VNDEEKAVESRRVVRAWSIERMRATEAESRQGWHRVMWQVVEWVVGMVARGQVGVKVWRVEESNIRSRLRRKVDHLGKRVVRSRRTHFSRAYGTRENV
jgi:hypothetical protein